jgi:hypothetical protein
MYGLITSSRRGGRGYYSRRVKEEGQRGLRRRRRAVDVYLYDIIAFVLEQALPFPTRVFRKTRRVYHSSLYLLRYKRDIFDDAVRIQSARLVSTRHPFRLRGRYTRTTLPVLTPTWTEPVTNAVRQTQATKDEEDMPVIRGMQT